MKSCFFWQGFCMLVMAKSSKFKIKSIWWLKKMISTDRRWKSSSASTVQKNKMEYLRPIVYWGYIALRAYLMIIIVTIILSWTPLSNTKFHNFLRKVCSPFLDLFHGWFVISNIDLTPLLGFLLYNLLLQGLETILF